MWLWMGLLEGCVDKLADRITFKSGLRSLNRKDHGVRPLNPYPRF
jgi:hypothetical protein